VRIAKCDQHGEDGLAGAGFADDDHLTMRQTTERSGDRAGVTGQRGNAPIDVAGLVEHHVAIRGDRSPGG
jgi:hypothetical protein